jgi:DNA primase
MNIPNEKLDEIAQASDIIEIVSSYIPVKKSGRSFLAVCPFHADKNPSMSISQEKQVYHCFSCGASGNVFRFVQEYEKITFVEAAVKLAERAGIDLQLRKGSPDLSNEISILFEINKEAAKFFNKNINELPQSEKDLVLNYLSKRKISNKTVKKFGIGYALKEWHTLQNHLLEEGLYKTEDIEKAGLIKESEKDKGKYYDRFRGRLMFPIFNENDRVVGFSGRNLFEDDSAKYMNSPETKIYNKSRVLYGLNFAKESIRALDHVILVEGQMDVISVSQAGIENVVASSGTSLTEDHVKLLSRYTKNVVILFDADMAGIKAARRGIEIILEAGLDLNVVTLPEGEDPDSFITKHGRGEFEKHISKKKSIISFIADIYKKEDKLSTVQDKANFIKEIISYISKMPDKIKRALFIKDISAAYGIYESDLRDELEAAMKQNKNTGYKKSSVVIPERNKAGTLSKRENFSKLEEKIIEIFVNGGTEAIGYLENNLEVEHIENKTILRTVEYLLDEFMNEGEIVVSNVINKIDSDEIKTLLTRLAIPKYSVSKFEKSSNNNILNKIASDRIDYLKEAQGVILDMEKRKMEKEIAELVKDTESWEANILKIRDLKKSIAALEDKKKLTGKS